MIGSEFPRTRGASLCQTAPHMKAFRGPEGRIRGREVGNQTFVIHGNVSRISPTQMTYAESLREGDITISYCGSARNGNGWPITGSAAAGNGILQHGRPGPGIPHRLADKAAEHQEPQRDTTLIDWDRHAVGMAAFSQARVTGV